MTTTSLKGLYLLLSAALFAGIVLTIFLGEIPWTIVWSGALDRLFNESSLWNPLLDERIPRILVILCTGASLAVSGAVMQALFQNPLASPSVLGISSGGCLLVTLVFVQGLYLNYPYAIPLAAFIGCLGTLILIFGLTRSQGTGTVHDLLLTGIAVSTVLIAIQGGIMYALRDQWQLIQTLTEWEAGSTFDRSWKHVHMQLPLTIAGLTGCFLYRQEIDMMAMGEEEALHLGVEVNAIRWRLFFCVSLLTAGAVAAVGMIPFFGLILPHLMRRFTGPDHKRLIPLCSLGGAVILLSIDLLLRHFQLYAISIGNVSALIGGLFFLTLLSKTKTQRNAFTG